MKYHLPFNNFKIIFIGCLFLLFFYHEANAQIDTTKNKKEIIGGFGNYEYLHGGLKFNCFENNYLESAIGIRPWGLEKEKYAMLYLAFGAELHEMTKHRRILPSIQLKALLWSLDNDFNYFLFLGVMPEVGIGYKLNNKISIQANGGVSYNIQMIYKRKTYEEVGWPYDWQPTFSIQIKYKLK